MFSNKKYEEKDFDTYLRIFPKVKAIKELSYLKIIILSDVISYKVQGLPYFKSSKALAKELNQGYKTVQNGFQELENDGYINTKPCNDGPYLNDLREVAVIDIEQWIYPDEYLNKIGFTPRLRQKKDKTLESQWKAVNAKKNKPNIKPVTEKIVGTPVQVKEESNIVNVSNTKVKEQKPQSFELDKGVPTQVKSMKEDFNVSRFLTPRKLEYAKRWEKQIANFKIEKLFDLDEATLIHLFYGPNKLWTIKSYSEDKELLVENINGINLSSPARGANCKMFTLDNKDLIKDYFYISPVSLDEYYCKNKKQFGDLNEDNFNTLRQYQSKPLSMYNI